MRKKLGAHNFIVTKTNNLASVAGSILDTVSAPHDLNLYLSLLRVNGVHICVGVPPTPYQVHAFSLIGGRKSCGFLSGGLPETQEMC
jgi:uncharacterized zinc-type alcohol dehydrogenase-like protein